MRETTSDSEAKAESDENEFSEDAPNLLSKERKVKLAVASDEPIFVGIEAERKLSEGGQKGVLGVGGLIEIGLERSRRINLIFPGVAWQKAFPNDLKTIRYGVDSVLSAQARLIVIHPRVQMPLYQEVILKKNVERLIIDQKGSIMYSVNRNIVPVDCNGIDLVEREDKETYRAQQKYQQLWVPKDVPGRVKDIILEPNLRRGIDSVSNVNNSSDPAGPRENQEMLEIEDQTST